MKFKKTFKTKFTDPSGAVRTGLAALMVVASLATALSSVGCGSKGNDNVGPVGAPQSSYMNGMNGINQCYNNNTPGVYLNNTCVPQQQTYLCQMPNGVVGITTPATPGVCNPTPQPIVPRCNGYDRLVIAPMNGLQVYLCQAINQYNQFQTQAQTCGGQYGYSYNQNCYGNIQWSLVL